MDQKKFPAAPPRPRLAHEHIKTMAVGASLKLQSHAVQPAKGMGSVAAPPVYRPQQGSQKRMSPIVQAKTPPPVYKPQMPDATRSAPPVYRPSQPAQPKIQVKAYRPAAVRNVHPAKTPLAGAQSAVQRYTEEDIAEFGGKGFLSEHETYFVHKENARIFAREGHSDPLESVQEVQKAYVYNGRNYYKFKPGTKRVLDCLKTAEEIMAGATFDDSEVHSQIKGTGGDLGRTLTETKANVKTAAKTLMHIDDDADPGLNEAYVIVETGKKNVYPYHAAAVVAVDGNDRVTLEVFAGANNAKARNVLGSYNIYSISDASQTFHSQWKDGYNKPVTIVAKPK